MMAIGIFVCTYLLIRDGKKQGIDSQNIIDLVFWVVVAGILGARLFYIILNLNYFIDNPAEILMLQRGGLAFQGSLIAGMLTGIAFCRKKQLPIVKMLDLALPYVALGQAFGRVGCFLNGCCFGREFANGIQSPWTHDLHHPTQLYLVSGMILVFIILSRIKRSNPVAGTITYMYLFLAPSVRFVVEFFRADHYNTLLGLSVYQFVCIGLIMTGFYVRSRIKSQRA